MTVLRPVTLAGATLLSPGMASHHRAESIENRPDHVAGQVLDQFGAAHDAFRRWSL